MNAGETQASIRRWAEQRRLPQAHLDRWLALDDLSAAALLEVAERVHLRTGQMVAAIDLLDEIAVRERTNIVSILARRELRRILDGAGSAPGKARALLEELRALRFPRLKQMTERLANEIGALKLPAGINVVLPHEFGSDELRIEITAHGGDELESLIEAVAKGGKELGRIARMLGGADEI